MILITAFIKHKMLQVVTVNYNKAEAILILCRYAEVHAHENVWLVTVMRVTVRCVPCAMTLGK